MGLVGYLLKRAAKSDYETLVRTRITGPLRMNDTMITLPPSHAARLAAPFDAYMRPVKPMDMAALAGAGAMRQDHRTGLDHVGCASARSLGGKKTRAGDASRGEHDRISGVELEADVKISSAANLWRARLARSLACALIALATLSQPPASGQEIVSAPAPMTEAQAAMVDQARGFIRKWLADNNIPGVSVAVGVNGRILWAEGFGWADLEQQVPVTQITRFRIGSASKPLTAAAAGLLYEQGALDLDAPIQTYVPSFPEKEWPITTRQLMGHTAGIRHYRNNAEGYSAAHFETVTDALSMFANDPLLFEPGSGYSYSSFGFNLVSAVVEGASKRSFLEFMRTEVFAPVGMRDTVADEVFTVTPHRARFYERDADGRLRNAAYVDQSNKWGSGGFLSTPSDLVRFGQAMIDNDLLQPQTKAMLWTPTRTASGEEHASGMGWALQNAGGMRLVGHPGGSVGGGTDFLMVPDQGIVVVVMANVSDAPLSPVLMNLIRMCLQASR